jgi:hypothetical protein
LREGKTSIPARVGATRIARSRSSSRTPAPINIEAAAHRSELEQLPQSAPELRGKAVVGDVDCANRTFQQVVHEHGTLHIAPFDVL